MREIVSALREKWHWVAGALAVGLLLALLVTWWMRPEYEAESMVVIRNADPGASALSRMGGAVGGMFGSLPLGLESVVDTELQILTSRSLAGRVVDSLGLQIKVLEPEATSGAEIVRSARVDADFDSGEFDFERSEQGVEVRGPGVRRTFPAGAPIELPGATLLLSDGAPHDFTLAILDRESAISDLLENLEAENTAGDVVKLSFRAGDRTTAAAVPNTLLDLYLERRTTTDRGVNQRRYEFLTHQVDSISIELARAEDALRQYQERNGLIDADRAGAAALDRATELRKQLEAVEVELRALEVLVNETESATLSVRRLAAYPTFLRNPAINDLLSRLLALETERSQLAQRRTEADPEMVGLSESIELMESQLASLSRAYLAGLVRQRASLVQELELARQQSADLPEVAVSSLRLQREVERLSETLLALQGGVVQARLGAIGEGGEVQAVDRATPPRRPESPKPGINIAAGLFGGLILGLVGAFGSAYLSPRVNSPRDAELETGVPALLLDARTPLLLGGVDAVGNVIVLGVGEGASARTVAHRIAGAAAVRGRRSLIAHVERESSQGLLPAAGASGAAGARLALPERVQEVHVNGGWDRISDLDREAELVVLSLESVVHPATEALLTEGRPIVLVGKQGTLMRTELRRTAQMLEQADVRLIGIVLQPKAQRNGSGSA